MRVLRTPDERFAGLPPSGPAPSYADVPDGDGRTLRMAWIADGPEDGPPVLLLHGEPKWSFLYRTMIPVLAAAGFRAIAPDLVGFGRSDKPAEIGDHSYARHVEWTRALVFDVFGTVVDWRDGRPAAADPDQFFDQTHYRLPIARSLTTEIAEAIVRLRTR